MQVKSLVDASLNVVGDFIMRPSPQSRLRSSKAEKGFVAALFAGPSGSSGCTFRPLVHLGTSGFSELPDFQTLSPKLKMLNLGPCSSRLRLLGRSLSMFVR